MYSNLPTYCRSASSWKSENHTRTNIRIPNSTQTQTHIQIYFYTYVHNHTVTTHTHTHGRIHTYTHHTVILLLKYILIFHEKKLMNLRCTKTFCTSWKNQDTKNITTGCYYAKVGPKLLRLVFVRMCSALYRTTLNVKMKFGSLHIEQDQNEHISLKTCRAMPLWREQ